ncbi:protein kinase domain-containing protein [Xanthobacter sp. AM11]|uniref:serine/threonine-protein kinase n=1 Tax=Xanthobacter sp. AM11 TaxID=3380643 RepID=UPI0039BF1BA4
MTMPARIGPYEVRRLLGAGGVGQVHVGFDPALGREVAIKSLRPELTNDPSFADRFRAEASSLAKLNHPNIATLYALVPEGQSLHMVMELVRGDTLETLISRSQAPMDPATAVSLVTQAGEGLCYAHAAGVFHRDIKPANLMVTESGLLKIMDFGIARVEGSQRLTRDGSIVGTLAYMAPEQMKGAQGDARSDLYSLAIVLYEMLAGRVPFRADTDYDLMRAQIETPPPRLSALARPGLNRNLEAVVMRALEKKPEKRFPDMRAFLDALAGEAPKATAGRALAQALLARPAAAAAPGAPPARPAPAAGGEGWFSGPLKGILVGTGAALAAIGLFLFLSREEAATLAPPGRTEAPIAMREARPQPEAERQPSRSNDLFIGGAKSARTPAPAEPPRPLVPAMDKPGPLGPRSAAEPDGGVPLPLLETGSTGAGQPVPAGATLANTAGDLAEAEIAYGQGDFKTALAIARPLAERGDAEAQFIIAKIYDGGRGGVEQNLPEAFKWYRRAAEQGLARAQFNVGRFYSLGRGGLPVSNQNAATWYARAAAAGDMDATYNLASLYYRGDLGPADVAKAKELFAKVMTSSSRLSADARKAYDFIVANYGK